MVCEMIAEEFARKGMFGDAIRLFDIAEIHVDSAVAGGAPSEQAGIATRTTAADGVGVQGEVCGSRKKTAIRQRRIRLPLQELPVSAGQMAS